MDQYSGPRTTADSEAEGRLKVDAGSVCKHNKKGKCLKCAMGKYKDGKGGPKLSFPIGSGGFGATDSQKIISISPVPVPSKKKKISIPKTKAIKGMKFKKSSISSIMKSMKLGKKSKAPKGMKVKSLKAILRGGK